MSKRVLLLWIMTVVMLAGSAVPVWAKPMPKPAPPNVPARAGSISALLPVARIVRGSGKSAVTTDAKKGDELVWNDLIKTEKGGRARVTLADQSILSLGSQAELRIVKHDPRSQQTTLQMAYGRVRAQVASITRDGGSFELRTPTAVAGVIGTDFGVDSSSVGGDTFICLTGAVQIANADPKVPGAVQCSAGQTTTVNVGKSPTAPKTASLQQLQQLIEDTEPAIISSIAPAAALPGTNFDSTIAGSKMGKVGTVSVAGGSGVTATIKSSTDTSVSIHVVVEGTATPGPRTITLTKETGASSATVFTVLGTPIGDPKKAYLDTLSQLRTTGASGLSAFLTGAQQAADQVAQQITQANQNLPKPLDLTTFADALNQQYGVVQNDLKSGDSSIDKAYEEAANTFAQLYDAAYAGLLQRDPTGTPDTTFKNALTAAFTQANGILQAALTNTQTSLNGAVQQYGNTLNTIQQTWSQNINTAFVDQQAGPLPKINALERIVELGATTSFDAGNSAASNSSVSITRFQWTLCSSSYQPSGFGQLLDSTVSACNGLQGYVSSSPEFPIATCSLSPGAYFARLAVTDSNNKVSQMDVKLTVLAPNYGTPSVALRGLADSYSSRQLSQFLRWFDPTQFNGYTVLSENIRQTLQQLASMNINLRVSQENLTCNDATVRADWEQNYSFINAPSTVLKQTEQLTVRMQRSPGIGWLITDFQGDNGKVQGVPPGPQNSDIAAPDLSVTDVSIDNGGQGTAASRQAARRVRGAASGTPIVGGSGQVSPGLHMVQATVTNIGKADLVQSVPISFTVQNGDGTQASVPVTVDVPVPIAAGASKIVTANVTFPDTTTALSLVASANTTCQPPEKVCGAENTSSLPVVIVHQPDLTIGTFTVPSVLQIGSTLAFSLPVSNPGLPAVAGWNIVVTLNGNSVFTATGPAVPTGQTVPIPVSFTVPQIAAAPVDQKNVPLVITINGNLVVPELNTANNTFTAQEEVADFVASVIPKVAQLGVVGRNFALSAVNVAPVPYPLPLAFSYTGAPAGLASSTTVTGNITGTALVGIPTAAGSSTVTISGGAGGVTHAVTGSIGVQVFNEISITPGTAPTFDSGGVAQNITANVTGGIYPVTVSLTLPTGFTTTSGTVVGSVSSQTITGPGVVTWSLSAGFTAATGTNLPILITATDAGFAGTSTPAGNKTANASYSINGQPGYVITSVTFVGHTAPYTGANALQEGETTQLAIVVANQGNTSPAGATLTVTADCGPTPQCQPPLTGTGAAPVAGQSVTINLPIQIQNLPVATYPGTVTVTSNVSGAILGPPSVTPFDVVDFTLTANTVAGGPQNLLIGGSGTISAQLAEQLPSGSPFPLTVTATPASNLSFTPPSSASSGGNVPFNVTVGASMPPSPNGATDTITVSATNRGVTKTATFPVNYFSVSLVSTSLFVNDAASPLAVPVATGVGAPPRIPRIDFRVVGNYDTSSGNANLTLQQPGCGTFTTNLSPTSVVPGDLPSLDIFANQGTNCVPGTQVLITAAIPQTNPPLTTTVYRLFVNATGLPVLGVTSATPSRDISNLPWLSGEALDWTVTVQNTGSGASTGNDRVTFLLGEAQAGQATLPSIPPGQQTTVNIHVVAHDLPEDSPNQRSDIRIHVENDPKGSLDPNSFLDFTNVVNIANWGIGITSGLGTSDFNSVQLTPTAPSSTTTIGVKNPAGFNPSIVLSLVTGAYSSGQLNAPGFSPSSLNGSGSSTVTLSYPAASTPVNGPYFVQVIAQMKDGATVTAQRQVTIHVQLNGLSNFAAGIALASDHQNIEPCPDGCFPAPQNITQLNGPLPEAIILTASISSCSAGNGCPGNADVSFTDTFATATTPPVSTVAVTQAGTAFPIRVKAADNPDGSINSGPADVSVSVNAVQANFFGAARTPNPDPVGALFLMKFNIGDLSVSTGGPCVSVAPQSQQAVNYFMSLDAFSGFNLASVSWEWEDSNHVQVSGSPLSFGTNSGSSSLSGTNYPLPTFSLLNTGQGVDGLQTYYFAVTVSNGIATATEYFPVDVDLSTGQNFCPQLGAARGGGGHRIKGVWGKAALAGPSLGRVAAARAANGKLPDVRVNATDVTFAPSMPKSGDTVSVRFRITNMGDADATNIPVALQVNGATVASDTFNVAVGHTTLGGLVWTNAHATAAAPAATASAAVITAGRPSRGSRDATGAVTTPLSDIVNAALVIDPQRTMTQKTAVAKSAPLSHFGLRNAAAEAATIATFGQQRVVLQLSEGGCSGLKFALGAGSCSSGDVTVTVEDLAKGTYKLEAAVGIADLGVGNTSYVNAIFGSQALGQNGHTYAVQLGGGRVGLLTMQAVRNPDQLSEAAKRIFRQQVAQAIRALGSNSQAPNPGDTAGTRKSDSMVYFDIVYQGQ